MDMTGQQHIPANKAEVWNALNDAEVLKVCIPGCQELTKSSDTEMSAVAVIKVGPVKARFQGAVTLSDLDPPNGYRITGEGQGGVAGFAKGVATVRLEAVEGGTVLHYTVDAQIGGKLSQLGGRLIDVTAKQMSGQFFRRFAEEIQARQKTLQSRAGSEKENALPQSIPAKASFAPTPSISSSPVPSNAASFVSLPMLAVVVFAAVLIAMWAIHGGLLPSLMPASGDLAADGRAHISPDLASLVQLIMAGAIGYLFGTRSRGHG
ncbi:carbon monoxide dehydrogenase [Sinorhizobium fredii]|uniref:Carbon monoxide dehydrogenase n=1 Tax=Rhizobium fredii TaxID=380 RepID=A0A2A6LW17_RHIFR|nr:carbon monoxide dehydrogenase subunit G [Sinorhizobium fredii]PDT46595.1 carbon monoxide dehydrogenase [Sinorhizobium fredii]